jgi:two-component system NarL family sensor kinase
MSPKPRYRRGDDDGLAGQGLGRAEAESRLVSAALTEAQEMERIRIAGELHDSIGQSLGALAMGVGVAMDMIAQGENAQAAQALGKVRTQIKDTIEEVRRIAMNLRPAGLDDLGMTGTLSWFFREFSQIYPSVRIAPSITVDESDVPPSLRLAVFRVIQEAFHNSIKHAAASELRVDLCRDPPDLVLRVADDGRGFHQIEDADFRTGNGVGLTVMRNRVEMTGGRFRLASEPGCGTTITACWPLFSNVAPIQ